MAFTVRELSMKQHTDIEKCRLHLCDHLPYNAHTVKDYTIFID